MSGTVYALTDPRDGTTRYVGATKQRLAVRLKGHLTTPALKVRPWILELRDTGLAPLIVPVRENVPDANLRAAETEEIVRALSTGADLLNEQISDQGRKVRDEFRAARQLAADQSGWRELADLALAALGGPMPPGELAEVEIPGLAWESMQITPEYREYATSLLRSGDRETLDERHREWRIFGNAQEAAAEAMWRVMRRRWSDLLHLDDRRDTFSDRLERCVGRVVHSPCGSRATASRHLGLIAWYVIAVEPWRHLAELSGLTADDATFIAWAGARDRGVRGALEFLAGRGERVLAMMSEDWTREYNDGPGRFLGTVAAAYTGTLPASAIRTGVLHVLGKAAEERELTSPMASLLLRLDPRALDHACGQDVAAELDAELGLPAGTSGRVARALAGRIDRRRGSRLHDIADRSAQELPTVPVPDYRGWHGPGVPGARSVGASLVSAGLAAPDRGTPDEYLARFREFWVPSTEDLARWEAA